MLSLVRLPLCCVVCSMLPAPAHPLLLLAGWLASQTLARSSMPAHSANAPAALAPACACPAYACPALPCPAGVTNELWSLRGLVEGEGEAPPQWTQLQLEGPAPAPRRGHAAASAGHWAVFVGGLTEQKSMMGIKSRSEYLSGQSSLQSAICSNQADVALARAVAGLPCFAVGGVAKS